MIPREVMEKAEALLYDLGLNKLTLGDLNSIEKFRAVGRDIQDEVRPKQVQIVRFDGEMLPKPKGDRVSIIPINDIHYGALSCNREKFEAYVDYILNTDDTYTIGVGDLIENATKFSVGMAMYEESVHLPDQLEYMADRLRPLAESGKLLGLQPGNHEFRTSVLAGIDPMQVLARWLDVPYLGWQAYWLFDVDGERYKALTFHGSSGASTRTGKLNAVRRLNQIIPDADFYVMGHVHDVAHDWDEYWTIDENGQLVRRQRHYIIAGSLLSYFGGYPEMAGYAPSPLRLVRIDMLSNRHEVQFHW